MAYTTAYALYCVACAALGISEYEGCETAKGTAAYDAAYFHFSTSHDPLSFISVHCTDACKHLAKNGVDCTPYEFACYMASALSAIGKLDDAALLVHYAESIRFVAGSEVLRL